MCIYLLIVYYDFFLCSLFFFFKQKTAYEMRISDWSSDVCSSDLIAITAKTTPRTIPSAMAQTVMMMVLTRPAMIAGAVKNWPTTRQAIWPSAKARSEERSVGKECVRTCRLRWWADHSKKTQRYTREIHNIRR